MNRMSRGLFCVLALVAIFFASPASAETPAKTTVFAIVIGNNRSLDLGRPDLRYADDDAAKYVELFRMIAAEQDVRLFTSFDKDSEKLYPKLATIARPPTKSALLAEAAEVEQRMRVAARRGEAVELYFVYAGHGDIDKGRGFLDLTDSPFSADDLEAFLRRLPPGRVHVILDSCNSFFVVNPRKPGGTHFATPRDAARTLSERLPNVGVFLSTSAEAEVFEWSELGAGIFSHAVRSGLSGAADANHDGVVTYDELRGFVDLASSRVVNPLFRPHVFARGPGGGRNEPLVRLRVARATTLHVAAPEALRLTIRDRSEIPIVDLYKEAGAVVDVRLPMSLAEGAVIDERNPSAPGVPVTRRYALPSAGADSLDSPGEILFASLAAGEVPTEARGPGDLFRMLYAEPFGPKALAAFEASTPASDAETVYGVSRDDVQRTTLALENAAAIEKNGRIVAGIAGLGLGTVLLGGSASILFDPDVYKDDAATKTYAGAVLAGSGAALLGLGAYALVRPSTGEKMLSSYKTDLAGGPSRHAYAVAHAENELRLAAERHRKARTFVAISAGALVLTGATSLVINELRPIDHTQRVNLRLLLGAVTVLGAEILGLSFLPTPIERVYDTYKKDPSIERSVRPTVNVSPTGFSVGLSRAF